MTSKNLKQNLSSIYPSEGSVCNLPSVLCFTICSALSRTSTLHKKTNGQSKNFQNHIPQANSCRLSRKWNIKKVLFCETRFLYSTLLISFNGKFKRRRANDIIFRARNLVSRAIARSLMVAAFPGEVMGPI